MSLSGMAFLRFVSQNLEALQRRRPQQRSSLAFRNVGKSCRNSQYPIPFEPGELFRGRVMLLLCPPEQLRKPQLLANWIEPRVARHGGIAKEPTADNTLHEVERQIGLVQMREVPRQIEESGSTIYCRGISPLQNKCPLKFLSGHLSCHC